MMLCALRPPRRKRKGAAPEGLTPVALGPEEAEEVRFQAARLLYLWASAAAAGVEAPLSGERAEYWAWRLARGRETLRDFTDLRHGFQVGAEGGWRKEGCEGKRLFYCECGRVCLRAARWLCFGVRGWRPGRARQEGCLGLTCRCAAKALWQAALRRGPGPFGRAAGAAQSCPPTPLPRRLLAPHTAAAGAAVAGGGAATMGRPARGRGGGRGGGAGGRRLELMRGARRAAPLRRPSHAEKRASERCGSAWGTRADLRAAAEKLLRDGGGVASD
jgi:hypothetical protein